MNFTDLMDSGEEFFVKDPTLDCEKGSLIQPTVDFWENSVLKVSAADTWLTVYCRRVIFPGKITQTKFGTSKRLWKF